MAGFKRIVNNKVINEEYNANWDLTLRSVGLTWINLCKDRLLYLPADGGIFVEAYTSAGGRQDSVINPNPMTTFGGKYVSSGATISTEGPSFTGTTSSSTAITVNFTVSCTPGNKVYFDAFPIRAHDSSVLNWRLQIVKSAVTLAEKTGSFASTGLVNFTFLDYSDGFENGDSGQFVYTRTSGSGSFRRRLSTQTYSGSLISFTGQQISCHDTGAQVPFRAYELDVNNSAITHTIPAGTFPSDMSSSILTFDPAEFEEGASVEYKLTNATEDTGWLATNKTEPFTPLTAEPDELIVRLTPKATSPTAGKPSVRGICLQAGRAIE